MRAEASLDRVALERLLRLGGVSLVADMIAIFFADAPERIQAVRAGARSSNFDVAQRATHSLKSAAGLLGARRLEKIAERIEQMARARDETAIERLLRDLDAAFSVVRDQLLAEQKRLSA